MANWEDIKTTVSRAADKTIKKAGELADTASLHFKYKTSKAKLGEKFEKLGRLTYKQLKTEISYAEEIASIITQIDELREEIKVLKQKIEDAKKEKETAKAENQDEEDVTDEASSAE